MRHAIRVSRWALSSVSDIRATRDGFVVFREYRERYGEILIYQFLLMQTISVEVVGFKNGN